MLHLHDVDPLSHAEREPVVVDMFLRDHKFRHGLRISDDKERLLMGSMLLAGCNLRKYLRAQDLVGGVTLSVFHGTAIAGREIIDVVVGRLTAVRARLAVR